MGSAPADDNGPGRLFRARDRRRQWLGAPRRMDGSTRENRVGPASESDHWSWFGAPVRPGRKHAHVFVDVEVATSQHHRRRGSRQATSDGPPDLFGHARRSLAEHLDPTLRGCLDHRIIGELALARHVLDEQIAHLEHVEEAFAVAPHSSTASASTCLATLGRSPRSVTTSTSRCRRS